MPYPLFVPNSGNYLVKIDASRSVANLAGAKLGHHLTLLDRNNSALTWSVLGERAANHGCMRKPSFRKADVVQALGIPALSPSTADKIVVSADGSSGSSF